MLKLFLVLTMTAVLVIPGTSLAVVPFTNTPLTVAEGDSEPAISIAANGTVGISGLQWLFDPNFFWHPLLEWIVRLDPHFHRPA